MNEDGSQNNDASYWMMWADTWKKYAKKYNNDIQDNYVHKNNFKEKFKEKDLNNFSFEYKTIKSNVFDSSYSLWGKFYRKSFLESLNDSYLCDKNIFNPINNFHSITMLRN